MTDANNHSSMDHDMPDRQARLKQVLHYATVRDSVPAWENAIAQLGPVTLDLVNELALVHVCATHGSLDILGVLKGMGADLRRVDQDGKTPIHLAAEHGDAELVAFLIDAGVPVDSRVEHPENALNLNGMTALHVAASAGQAEVCEVLLQHGADVGARCQQGLTPLRRAMMNAANDRAVEVLLRAGANDAEIEQAWRELHPQSELANAFQMVVRQGMVATASYYLAERGADPDQLTKKGKTLMQVAKQAGVKAGEMRDTILSHRCCADVLTKAACGSRVGPSLGI